MEDAELSHEKSFSTRKKWGIYQINCKVYEEIYMGGGWGKGNQKKRILYFRTIKMGM